MHKTLIIRENKTEIVLRILIRTSGREIARFQKCGMGYVALGAAGRAIVKGVGHIDEIAFDGQKETYDMLVNLGVIEPLNAAA